jgi:hypothetical protein
MTLPDATEMCGEEASPQPIATRGWGAGDGGDKGEVDSARGPQSPVITTMTGAAELPGFNPEMNAFHSSGAKTRIGVESGDLLSQTATLPSGRSEISTYDWVAHHELRRHAIGEAMTRAALPCAAWPPSAGSRISRSAPEMPLPCRAAVG